MKLERDTGGEDDEGDRVVTYEYYNISGTRLTGIGGSADLRYAMDDYGLFSIGDKTYQSFDANGVAHNMISIQKSHGCSIGTFDSYWEIVTEEDSEGVDENGEEENGYAYQLALYNLDGSLKVSIGEVTSLHAPLNRVYDRGMVVGYELPAYSSPSERSVYYDLEFNVVAERPTAPDASSVTPARTPSWTLPNGTDLYRESAGRIADANGNPVMIGGYTLGICMEGSPYSAYNTVKRGGSDIWWASDSSGKWGAITSSGEVKVPFIYDAYYDGGRDDTDYALAREGLTWSFVNVQSGATSGTTASPTAFGDAKVTAPEQVYTGAALTPDVTVTLAGNVLPKDAYDVSYPFAVNAGTYMITVTGKGQYSGTATGVFTVVGAAIPDAAISGVAGKTYTGKALKQPKLTVTVNGKVLAIKTDYEVRYRNNTAAGTATVVVVGKGNYAGEVSKTFSIAKANISKATAAKVKVQKLKAAGKAVKPKVKVTYRGKKLKAGRDYKLTYKNNKQRGIAKAIAKGRGNFKGMKTISFTIR